MINENPILNTYAAYSINHAERRNSSSGGIFSLVAREVLAKSGVVYGVAMAADCKRAEFVRVVEENNLKLLRGSKYMQAYMGCTFKKVKDDLDGGAIVLFSGTGCQVNGLKKFLCDGTYDMEAFNQKYPNLICIEVVCHGAPSSKLWNKYSSHIEGTCNSKLVRVYFRCKDNGWLNYGVKRVTADKNQVMIPQSKDPYMLMFLRDYCLRPACYECCAKKVKLSDITLGDFWGIDKVNPKMNDGMGTSLIIIRTEKGREIFGLIQDKLKFSEEKYEDSVRENRSEYISASRPKQREVFYKDMQRMSFSKLEKKYGMPDIDSLHRRVKILIKKILIRAKSIGKDGGERYQG